MQPTSSQPSETLTTYAIRDRSSTGAYVVYWNTSKKKQGVAHVEFQDGDLDDMAIAAELTVMRDLLVTRNVYGEGRSGRNLKFVVSFGAIKKLAKGISTKVHLFQFANFLVTRFKDAEIEVIDSAPWFNERNALNRHWKVSGAEPKGEMLNMPGVGLVEVTKHAFDQYMKRFNICDYSEAWNKIRNSILHPGISGIDLPGHVLDKKLGKYDFPAKFYRSPTDGAVFVVVTSDDGRKIAVTAYLRT